MNILARLVLALGGVSLIAAVAVAVVFTLFMERLTDQAAEQQLASLFSRLDTSLAAEGERALSLATVVAENPTASAAFDAGDREALLAMYRPAFERMRDDFGVRQFQFHTPPATSFVRIHKPEKFGDDLSGFRKTVVAANQERTPIRGLERGVAGLGMRGVSPVFHDGAHVGSVEFGLSFGQPFFESFAAATGARVGLYLQTDGGTFEPFASTDANGRRYLTDTDLAAALDGTPVTEEITDGDITLALMARPVQDYRGRNIGVATIALDATPFHERMADARWLAVIATVAALLGALVIGTLIARGIAGPVQLVTDALVRLSKRDYTVALPDAKGRGELPRMIRALKDFREKAQEVDAAQRSHAARVADLERQAHDVASQARLNLRGTVSAAIQSNEAMITLAHMMYEVKTANTQTQTVASAVEQMEASTREISGTSEQAAHDAESARTAAGEGVTGAGKAVESMEDIYTAVRGAADRVDTLAEASAQIGEIVQQIEDIADQTNLLALNATIEAARAGDAGKGFAVVANEVKSLASQTARATEDIRGRIATLRDEIATIVEAMDTGARAVEDGRGVISGLGGQLEGIAGGISGVTEKMQAIAHLLGQQTQSARDIASGTAAIADVSGRNTEEVQQAIDSMDDATGVLNEQVNRFASLAGSLVMVEVAKNDHVLFKKRIVDTVIGRDTWKAEEIPDHTACRLGTWYKEVTIPELRNHPAYRDLDAPHAEVHRHGREAVRKAAAGDMDGALQSLDALNTASHAVVNRLNDLSAVVEGMEDRRLKEEAQAL
ncbi:methyl-accepting chemotaxis protein [Roseospira goensis]|uniref:Methyl-accepting chemotaxis protein n=1 Tax=Roseospira goensis TaxID=391922 RepID=A0A7W6S1N1_9PROT|nr:cache domain-containing protein [Roseospira goensis]MBB4287066.1 methyl-accepting chemotaxis protein [Roseospira goensis]